LAFPKLPANPKEVTNVSVDIVLDQPIGSARPVRLGPFAKVRITHRRIVAGSAKVVRRVDGAWHFGDAAFLEARLEASSSGGRNLVQVDFARPWAKPSPSERSSSLSLYGSRLLGSGKWIASDDDDARCWVAEDSGLAHDGLLITAA
jgi:hypothetical protein